VLHPLLLLDSSYMFRKSFDAACQFAGFVPNVAIQSRGPHTLLALAEAGHGVAIIQTAVPIRRYKIRIVRITHRRKPIRLPMAAVWNRGRPLPTYAAELCRLLADHVRTVIPAIPPKSSKIR
jgi:DNA-binding transcriptional LysR family regulator